MTLAEIHALCMILDDLLPVSGAFECRKPLGIAERFGLENMELRRVELFIVELRTAELLTALCPTIRSEKSLGRRIEGVAEGRGFGHIECEGEEWALFSCSCSLYHGYVLVWSPQTVGSSFMWKIAEITKMQKYASTSHISETRTSP